MGGRWTRGGETMDYGGGMDKNKTSKIKTVRDLKVYPVK
jgi:hypothetical protein